MSCCTADPDRPALGPADPRKHVNYVLGMVLGVDDLTQEFAYLDNRVRAVARELIGFGTDRGLTVSVEPTATGPRVRVATGVAYTPSGQMVCVGSDQCAPLNAWLADQRDELNRRLGGAAQATLRLAVALCYRECLTDKVPIPGDPCRSEDALMSPSRVKDEFTLELRFSRPVQSEEDVVRELVRWLRAVPVQDSSLPSSPEDLVAALRAAASTHGSPLALELGDPPPGLTIPPTDCAEHLRAAFRLWVTELRPAWIARYGGCHACECDDAHDDCVLLAELDVAVLLDSPGGWVASDVDPVVIDESRRPFLLHARLQQEWLLSLCCSDGGAPAPPSPAALPDLGGDLSGPIGSGVVERIQTVPIVAAGANEKQVLTFVGGAWRPANATVVPTDLAGDAAGPLDATRVEKLQTVPVELKQPGLDEVLTFDGASWTPRPVNVPPPALPALAGDVTGAIASNTVVRLQGVAVDPSAPGNGHYLGFDGAHWKPMPVTVAPPPVPTLAGDVVGPIGVNEVTGLRSHPVAAPAAADDGAALVFRTNHWEFGRFAEVGSYVRYPDVESGYALVAAGRFGFEINANGVDVGEFAYAPGINLPTRSFNGLKPVGVSPGLALPLRIDFTFRDYPEHLRRGVLIVKSTAGFLLPEPNIRRRFPKKGTGTPFQVMFCEYTERTFAILIPMGWNLDNMRSITAGEIQIEVGWYPE